MRDEEDSINNEQVSTDLPAETPGVPDVLSEAVIAASMGIPPQIQRSLYKTLGHLMSAGTEWPAAVLKGKAAISKAKAKVEIAKLEAEVAEINAQQKARDVLTRARAKLDAAKLTDPALPLRGLDYHDRKAILDQSINEDVLLFAAEELHRDPPKQDSTSEIDEDWLRELFKQAPSRSSEEYKRLFGRILAGEIKQPGTFSFTTLRALAVLTSGAAQIFQDFCNVSSIIVGDAKVISDPFGDPGANSIAQFNLPYRNLITLVEAGLVRSTFNEWLDVPLLVFELSLPFQIANVTVIGRITDSELFRAHGTHMRLSGPTFTSVGAELRQVVELKVSEEYLGALTKWFSERGIGLSVSIAPKAA